MEGFNKYIEEKGNTLYLVEDTGVEQHLSKYAGKDFISSFIEISDKGLFDTLVTACSKSMLGFDITVDSEVDEEDFLFGKSSYYAVVSVNLQQEDDFVEEMYDHGMKLVLLGHSTKGDIRIDDESEGNIKDFIK